MSVSAWWVYILALNYQSLPGQPLSPRVVGLPVSLRIGGVSQPSAKGLQVVKLQKIGGQCRCLQSKLVLWEGPRDWPLAAWWLCYPHKSWAKDKHKRTSFEQSRTDRPLLRSPESWFLVGAPVATPEEAHPLHTDWCPLSQLSCHVQRLSASASPLRSDAVVSTLPLFSAHSVEGWTSESRILLNFYTKGNRIQTTLKKGQEIDISLN